MLRSHEEKYRVVTLANERIEAAVAHEGKKTGLIYFFVGFIPTHFADGVL